MKKRIALIALSAIIVGLTAITLTGCGRSLHTYWDARLVRRGYPEIISSRIEIRGLTNAGMQQRILTVPKEISGETNIWLTGRTAFPGGGNISPDLGILEGVIFEGIPNVASGDNRGGGFFRDSNLRWVELEEKQINPLENGGDNGDAAVNSRFPIGTVIIYRQNNSGDFNLSQLDSSLIHVFADQFDASLMPDEIWKEVQS
ncbi:MAG: hypothetical protein FWE31_05185 [Firmicutes bacterium]|nr:hypothetical protein [Bacillota bacterium]